MGPTFGRMERPSKKPGKKGQRESGPASRRFYEIEREGKSGGDCLAWKKQNRGVSVGEKGGQSKKPGIV